MNHRIFGSHIYKIMIELHDKNCTNLKVTSNEPKVVMKKFSWTKSRPISANHFSSYSRHIGWQLAAAGVVKF